MRREILSIFVYSIPVILIATFVLSIILFVKRKKIIEKYDVGYISSFLFTSYMLCPLIMGIAALMENNDISALMANNDEANLAKFVALGSLIYPIIGMIIFMVVYRGKSFKYKCGKFFAMLGIGICAGYIVVFKMLSFFHHYESISSSSYTSSSTSNTSVRVTNRVGQTANYYDGNSGRITNQTGQTAGYYDGDSGRITNQSGQTTGYYYGDSGRITNQIGQTTGYYDKETGRVTDASGSTVGYVDRN